MLVGSVYQNILDLNFGLFGGHPEHAVSCRVEEEEFNFARLFSTQLCKEFLEPHINPLQTTSTYIVPVPYLDHFHKAGRRNPNRQSHVRRRHKMRSKG